MSTVIDDVESNQSQKTVQSSSKSSSHSGQSQLRCVAFRLNRFYSQMLAAYQDELYKNEDESVRAWRLPTSGLLRKLDAVFQQVAVVESRSFEERQDRYDVSAALERRGAYLDCLPLLLGNSLLHANDRYAKAEQLLIDLQSELEGVCKKWFGGGLSNVRSMCAVKSDWFVGNQWQWLIEEIVSECVSSLRRDEFRLRSAAISTRQWLAVRGIRYSGEKIPSKSEDKLANLLGKQYEATELWKRLKRLCLYSRGIELAQLTADEDKFDWILSRSPVAGGVFKAVRKTHTKETRFTIELGRCVSSIVAADPTDESEAPARLVSGVLKSIVKRHNKLASKESLINPPTK